MDRFSCLDNLRIQSASFTFCMSLQWLDLSYDKVACYRLAKEVFLIINMWTLIVYYSVIRCVVYHYAGIMLLLLAPPFHRRMVEGSNNRFYAHRPMLYPPSNRNPGPLVDWWPPPFNQQVPHVHGSRPQIRDL